MRIVLIMIIAAGLSACAPEAKDMPPQLSDTLSDDQLAAIPPTPVVPDPVDVPQRIQDIDFTSYSRDLAQPLGLDITEDEDAAKSKIQTYFQPQKGAEGNAEYNFIEFGGVGATVMLASASGIADDSVKAEELFAVFKDGALVDYGMKIKCWRGDNPDQWQTELCS